MSSCLGNASTVASDDHAVSTAQHLQLVDIPYHLLLEEFDQFCMETVCKHDDGEDVEEQKHAMVEEAMPASDIDVARTSAMIQQQQHRWSSLVLLCSKLSKWIYRTPETLPDLEFECDDEASADPEWIYKHIVLTKHTQTAQYALLQHNKCRRNLFLVFKGTTTEHVIDTISDMSFIPQPIFCERQDETYWDFGVHSGIHASLMRSVHDIWKLISQQTFETLIVTGHSLGGGLSVAFALQTIIHEYLSKINKRMVVITYGAPTVISRELAFEALSSHSQSVLNELHSLCHNFVNRFDPIARIGTRPEWFVTVIPYAMHRIIQTKMSSKMAAFAPFISAGSQSLSHSFVRSAGTYMDILASYHPIGTYLFVVDDADEPYITKDCDAIEEILGYMPPHKVFDGHGNRIRVCHAATKMDGLTDTKFSLKCIYSIIHETMQKKNDTTNDKQPSNSNNEVCSMVLVDFLRHNDYDGEWNVEKCVYRLMESDDEQINRCIEKRKLSAQNWAQIADDHYIDSYIRLFTSLQEKSISFGHVEALSMQIAHALSDHENSKQSFLPAAIYKLGRTMTDKLRKKMQM